MPPIDIAELRRLHQAAAFASDEWDDSAKGIYNALPSLLDELEAAREELRQLRGKVEVMKKEAKQHFADLTYTEFERDECLLESEKLAANLEFLRAEVSDIHDGLCLARDAAPGMEWAELVQAAESCGSALSLIADMSTRLDARDRRMKLLGAAEWIEKTVSLGRDEGLNHLDIGFSYLLEIAAQLRREAEEK